jgi:transmembrane 9 superfamily protein 2/4
VVTCAEITIVLCYFQLCAEDYNWWWRSFLASGSTALYVFLYSAFYFSKLEPSLFVTYVLYFGYMSIICLGLFLLTGCIGFLACLWFTRTIYGSIKVD